MSTRVNCIPVSFEALENRMMLSAAPALHHHHSHHNTAPAAIHSAPKAAKTPLVTRASAKAGDPIYMNYTGIPGDVTASGHLGEIQLNSFQWGVGRGISSPTGGAANREASAPSVSEITVTKALDVASPYLLNEALQGQGKDVKIFFVKTNRGKLFTYAEYDLSNVMISGYSISSGGDRPSESISLNFTKVTFISYPPGPTGTPVKVTWDLALAKAG